jgi:D-arabinose 1-dehydrogenase-like Zn-dependent alcohol dehydrogenase
MGVKFAHALGAHEVMITTSPSQGRDAVRLGAGELPAASTIGWRMGPWKASPLTTG